jgi:hypothetical protein
VAIKVAGQPASGAGMISPVCFAYLSFTVSIETLISTLTPMTDKLEEWIRNPTDDRYTT